MEKVNADYKAWSYLVSDTVAELVDRKYAVGKAAVCGPNTGSVSPMFSCIKTKSGIRQQHPKRVKSIT